MDQTMTLVEWCTDYYAPLRNCASRTVDLYLQTIARFREFLGREPVLSDFNDITVARFLQARTRRGITLATVAKDRAQLAGMWGLAARRRLVSEFPTLPPIRSPERVPQAWTLEQMQALMTAIGGLRKNVGKYPARVWWRALIHVMWDTGERVSAVMHVRIENLDVKRAMLTIPAELRKNKTRDLVFQLAPDTLRALLPLVDGEEDHKRPIFAWPTWPSHIYWHYNKILKRAGLPTDSRSKFHRIRKTVATHYKMAGGDATALLDHSSPAVTRKYIDPTIAKPMMPSDVLPSIEPKKDHPAAGPHFNL